MKMSKKNFTPTLLADFYKISHREQYPEGTEMIYSTWTPRTSRKEGITEVVAFGFQSFIKEYLIDYFNDNFFNKTKEDVVSEYIRVIKFTLGKEVVDTQHIEDLHDLGYLPIKIKAVDEGTLIPIRVPLMTIENTNPKFFWITNFLETLMSCQLWQPTTSATIAYQYRMILDKYASETNGDLSGVQFQGHDFSMRGMGSLESAMLSGSGHLLSFTGTDTIPAIHYLEQYYNANIEKELVGCSISATEHSVMCTYGKENEIEAYKRLITEVYPSGFASIVSDTWDLWEVLDKIIKPLKKEILNRDGRIVVRPDSGDPVEIICGNPNGETEDERNGVVEILWDIFGGTITDKGFKQLDTHIGCIYGDAITIERCEEICNRLKAKGFASTNMVYGIGSYTYQYNTRDTFGFALKSTYAVVNGEERMLFKDPVTDNGVKKSQRGKVVVLDSNDGIIYKDGLNATEEAMVKDNLLTKVFENGKLIKDLSLSEIRNKLLNN
jgi:nicotinamide phosphoribosyltransferase